MSEIVSDKGLDSGINFVKFLREIIKSLHFNVFPDQISTKPVS